MAKKDTDDKKKVKMAAMTPSVKREEKTEKKKTRPTGNLLQQSKGY